MAAAAAAPSAMVAGLPSTSETTPLPMERKAPRLVPLLSKTAPAHGGALALKSLAGRKEVRVAAPPTPALPLPWVVKDPSVSMGVAGVVTPRRC